MNKIIVKSLKENKKKSYYDVVIEDKSYLFSEEIVIKYRLVENKEIDEKILKLAIKDNDLSKYYNMALNYAIRYGKSSNAVTDYLLEKGLSMNDSKKIVLELIDKKIINDNNLIISITSSLVRNSNGTLLIKNKLYEKGFSKELIDYAISNIDIEEYNNALISLYNKVKKKYQKYDEKLRKYKIKNYLLSRGYFSYDLDILDM